MGARTLAAPALRITETFVSLQGESLASGLPTFFIRLTGCPLRCTYCDSAYAFKGGTQQTLESLLIGASDAAVRHVCVTGGEPLAQPSCLALLSMLCDSGFSVSLETSGALDISSVDPRVVKVIDIKTPRSGEVSKNLWSNLSHLQAHDQIKFVICDRADFDWACAQVRRLDTPAERVFFSPSFEELPAATLADWLLESGVAARLQLQLHKLLWGDVAGR